MNYSIYYELYQIKRELNSIIGELETISYGLRYNFSGIGSEYCSSAMQSVISDYRYLLRYLNNVDINNISK